MKSIMIALLALGYSSSAWAVGIAPTPDSGSSIVLLAVGIAGLSVVRRAFRR